MQVEFDRYSLKLDGARVLVRAGSLLSFRLRDPMLWRARIAKMKEAGLAVVERSYEGDHRLTNEMARDAATFAA